MKPVVVFLNWQEVKHYPSPYSTLPTEKTDLIIISISHWPCSDDTLMQVYFPPLELSLTTI